MTECEHLWTIHKEWKDEALARFVEQTLFRKRYYINERSSFSIAGSVTLGIYKTWYCQKCRAIETLYERKFTLQEAANHYNVAIYDKDKKAYAVPEGIELNA